MLARAVEPSLHYKTAPPAAILEEHSRMQKRDGALAQIKSGEQGTTNAESSSTQIPDQLSVQITRYRLIGFHPKPPKRLRRQRSSLSQPPLAVHLRCCRGQRLLRTERTPSASAPGVLASPSFPDRKLEVHPGENLPAWRTWTIVPDRVLRFDEGVHGDTPLELEDPAHAHADREVAGTTFHVEIPDRRGSKIESLVKVYVDDRLHRQEVDVLPQIAPGKRGLIGDEPSKRINAPMRP